MKIRHALLLAEWIPLHSQPQFLHRGQQHGTPLHHAADGALRPLRRGQTIMIEQQVTAMKTTLNRMQVNGIELNVMLAGDSNSGPTVLLVHGFPDDHTVWRHQVPVLVKAGYRVVAPDTRGCGDSELDAGSEPVPVVEFERITGSKTSVISECVGRPMIHSLIEMTPY